MKSRRKIWPWVLAVAGVLLAAGIGAFLWFRSPGLHILGPFWHVDLSAECYRFDLPGGEADGAATVNVQGTANRIRHSFHGVITVDGLDSKGDSEGVHDHTFTLGEDGTGRILYIDSFLTRDEAGNLYPSFDGYFFYVTLEPEGTLTLVARYEEENSREDLFAAVQADSPEAARAKYEELAEVQLKS